MDPTIPVTPPVDAAPHPASHPAAPPAGEPAPEVVAAAPVEQVGADAGVQPVVAVEEAQTVATSGPRQYSSLYDTKATTVAAILFGVLIVGGIQFIVARMYAHAKNEQEYLTRFVTALVALVMGAYIADLLIAGPDTSLLSPEEHLTILGFVKDVCLMVFAYFFGTKSGGGGNPPAVPATDISSE
jgi:hypothetical protein